MSFSERHQLMLREMGIRVWQPVPVVPGAVGTPPPVHPGPAAAAAPGPAAGAVAPRPPASRAAPADSAVPTAAAAPAAAPTELSPTIATLGWPELRQAVADCRACSLCETRKQTVFGVGHPDARWMVVGEAPGEQEDLAGEPFVGAAGQLLDNMLRALQLTRAADGDVPPERRVYIANTLKCRPPRNRNPEPDELARCEPFLQRQLQLLKPRLILAMGRFAVQALLRSNEAVGKLRGRVHHYQGIPLVVTYHPAYLLRNLPDKARAWEDLCLAAATFNASTREPGADEQAHTPTADASR